MTKRPTCFFSLMVMLLFLLGACGKNKGDDTPPADQYSKFFKNTLWSGEFKYATRTYPDVVGISFNGNNTFIWRDMDGDFAGTYTIDNNGMLELLFTVSGARLSAKVSKEGALSDFRYAQATWEIHKLTLSTITTTAMTGTTWKNTKDGPTVSLLTFNPTNQVRNSYHDRSTTYAQNDQSIRFGYSQDGIVKVEFRYLLIQVSDKEMIGLEKRTFPQNGLINSYRILMTRQ